MASASCSVTACDSAKRDGQTQLSDPALPAASRRLIIFILLRIIFRENKEIFLMYTTNELLSNLDKLHTTDLGAVRIKKNLSLDTDEVIEWCKLSIKQPDASVTRSGKNWYVRVNGCILTIHAHSYTVITAHKIKK